MARSSWIKQHLSLIGALLVLVGFIGIFSVAINSGSGGGIRGDYRDENAVTYTNDDYTGTAPGNPAADDGELHDARSYDVEYAIREEYWSNSGVKHLKAYGRDVELAFTINYPRLEGDLEHLDQINDLLRTTAFETMRTYYEDPGTKEIQEFARGIDALERGDDAAFASGADGYLSSRVTYAVTYNSDDLLSVCYSDECSIGTWQNDFIRLRTVNVNLKTGEVYLLDDVLTVDESIANSFVGNLLKTTGRDYDENGVIDDDECTTVSVIGRKQLIEGILGKGPLAEEGAISTCLFIDGKGKPNLGVTYSSGDEHWVRGWWDVTITDEQVAAAKKDSTLWDLL